MNKIIKYIKKYRFNSVFFSNFFKTFVFFLVIMLLVSFVIYSNITKRVNKEMSIENDNLVNGISNSADIRFREIEYVAANISVDQIVRIYLSSNENKIYTDMKNKIANTVISYKSISKNIHSIYIYSAINNIVWSIDGEFAPEDFSDNGWLSASNLNSSFKAFPRKINGTYPYVLTFVKKVDNLGYVILNIDIAKFTEDFNKIGKNQNEFFIIADDNKVIYSNQPSEFANSIDDRGTNTLLKKPGILKVGNDVFAGSVKASEFYNWKYGIITARLDYTSQVKFTQMLIILSFVGLLIIFFVVSVFIAISTVKPISGLVDIIDHTESDTLGKLKDNEIKYIATRFFRIIDYNKELKSELSERLLGYSKYQAMALQSQVDPHFLNNTLSSINYEIIEKLGNDANASKMLVALTRLIRYCFVIDEMLVPLTEEIEFLILYANLLKFRYGDFKLNIEIENEIKDEKILRLCLQPFVENAVYHGISEKGKDGNIDITAYKNKDSLFVEVKDNGEGISEEKLMEIKNSFANDSFENNQIGMKNVYKRLKIVFGDAADLTVISRPGEFTKVIVKIPDNKS